MIATRDGEARLVVADHLDWEHELEHLQLLQDKLNAYLAFVENGDLRRSRPDLAGAAVSIHVVFQHEPTDHARRHFLDTAQAAVASAGLRLTWEVQEAA